MARTSLSDARALPDPLMTYNWDLVIPVMPGTANPRSFTYKAMSAVIPGKLLEQVPVNLGPAEIRYAGRENNSHSFACTIHETRDVGTREMLRRWQRLARDNAANTGTYKDVYSTTIDLILYDDLPQQVRRITMYGAFPETIDDATLDRASAAVSISVTFSYDDFAEE